MNKNDTSRVLQAVARDVVPADINLMPRIMEQIEKRNRSKVKSLMKPVTAFVLFMMIMIVVLVSVPGAANAMRRMLGYIPNVGVVEQEASIRVLAEPVKAHQNGISITIEQAVLDSEQTVILYQVENLITPEDPGEDSCSQLPSLHLPDGTEMEGNGSGSGWALGYNRRLIYPAVPSSADDAVLIFPCVQQTARSAAPENWEIPLHFVSAPPDISVYPIIDLPTPTAATVSSPPQESAQQETMSSEVTGDDITFSINSLIPLDDGNILFGTLKPANADVYVEMVDPHALHLLDSTGQEIPLEEDGTLVFTPTPGDNTFRLAYKTSGSYTSGLAVFAIDSIWINQNVSANFVFDPGSNPQPGQTWELNQDVEVAGKTLRVASVALDASGKGLTFTFDPSSEIQSAILTDVDHPLTGGSGGPGTSGFSYSNGLPDQPIQVSVTSISFELAGPWQTTLNLPASASAATQAPDSSTVCLTRESWNQAVNKKSSLPDGLTGTLGMSFLTEGDYNYQVMATDLDGTDRRVAGYGDWPSLSPDGSKLVYTAETGLVIVDLATNRSEPVSGTTKSDRGAIWSPDGSQIAFTRGPSTLIGAPGPYSIWVAATDGSDLRQVTGGYDANHAMGWMPTGDRILYTVEKPDGAFVRTIDIDNGEVVPLFETSYTHSTIALSPDGKQVAFEEVLPGDRYAIFVSDLNGSNKRMLTDPSPVIATIPIWSPDGNWLAVSAWDPNSDSYLSVLTLIQVDTCQIVPLTNLSGYVYTWNE